MLRIVSECSGLLLTIGVVADKTCKEEIHKSISSFVLILEFFNVCLIDILHRILEALS